MDPLYLKLLSVLMGAVWGSIWLKHTANKVGSNMRQVMYTGAVLEMVPFKNLELSPLENMLENVRIMSEYAQEAKEQGADIIVFPEHVIYNDPPVDRDSFLPYTQYVPDPGSKVAPCSLNTPFNNDEVVRNMSCMAKQLGMYSVFNMPERVDCTPEDDIFCPDDNRYYFNANVVFDREGIVVSKWRKLHLFKEPWFNEGNRLDDTAIFTTDFGVKFTQQICFDAVFDRPALRNIEKYGIKDIVMSTSWVDFLPFITAPQTQYAFSRSTEANLLVAGRHVPTRTAIGSGIYTGATDITKSINVYDDTRGTQLLVKEITSYADPKDIKRRTSKPLTTLSKPRDQESMVKVTKNHGFLNEDLSRFYQEQLSTGSRQSMNGIYETEMGNESIAYSLEWELEGDAEYRFFLFSGPVGFEEYVVYRQIGAVLYCPEGLESCGKVLHEVEKPTKATFRHLKMTLYFDTKRLFPAIIDQDLALVSEDKWEYTTWKEGDKYAASIVNKEPLDFVFSAAVYGRWYDRDPFCTVRLC